MVSNSLILQLLFVASIFYLTASAILCEELDKAFGGRGPGCSKEYSYAVAVGAVSLFVSGVLMLLGIFMPNLPEISHSIGGLFMLVWWSAGCGVGTFRAPFILPSNGYFSAWIAFIASVIYAVNNVELLKKGVDSSKGFDSISYCLLILVCVNIMFLTAAGVECDTATCTNYEAYAVSVGAIGLFICGIFYAQNALDSLFGLGKFLAGFNALWWGLGASITTFKEPFESVGNGYFSGWISFFAAGYLFCLMTPEVAKKFGKAAEQPQDTNSAKQKNNNDAPPAENP